MSDSKSSTTLAPLFRAQRALVDSTIETQKTIHSRGIELTRESTKAVFGVFLSDTEAEETVETATDAASDTAESTADAVEETADVATDAAEKTADAADEALAGVPVVTIDGIGATYSSRLEEAGFGTASDLATASVEEVAAVAQVGTDRAAEWIDRAQSQA